MNPLSDGIGHLAWTQLWQVTLVAGAVGVATRLFCRRRPHVAYVLWMMVLVKSLTPPIWASPTGLFSWSAALLTSTTAPAATSDDGSQDEMLRLYGRQDDRSSRVASADDSNAVEGAAAVQVTGMTGDDRPGIWSALRISNLVAWAWLLGAAGCALATLISAGRLRRAVVKSQLPVDSSLTDFSDRLCAVLGVRRAVRLIIVRELIGPLALGWLRPAIVLPERLVASHSLAQLEPLMAHELVHVRQNDSFVGLLQSVVQCLWWFHPLVWWANRQIVEERERCCDEAVVAGLNCPPGRYARSLLDVLEWKWQERWLASVPGMRAFQINQRRLEHLMRHPGRFRDALSCRDWLFLLVGLLLVIPGAGMGRRNEVAATPVAQAAPVNLLAREIPVAEDLAETAAAKSDTPKQSAERAPATAAEPQAAPRGPQIDIYAMNVDGSNARKVADIPGFPIINSPEISPDGKWVAVDGWTWDQNLRDAHLLLVNLETAQVKDLGIGAMPTWSADGLSIALSRYRPNGGVFIRELEGATERLIDPQGWGIQWAPDGRQLAYGRYGNVVVYDVRSNDARELFPAGASPYESIYWNCKWSPDSKRICFKGRRQDESIDIAIVSAVGGDPHLLIVCDGQDYNEDIGWHPDGKRVTIPRKAMPGQPGQIYEFNPDDGQPPVLLAGQPADRNNGGMCFSHDGKTFYFMSHK